MTAFIMSCMTASMHDNTRPPWPQALLRDLEAELPGIRAAADSTSKRAAELGTQQRQAAGRAAQLAQACGAEAGAWRQAWAGLRDGVPPELALPLPAWLAAAAQTPLGVSLRPVAGGSPL